LEPVELVEKTPLLGHPAFRHTIDRDLTDCDRAAGRRDTAELAAMGSPRRVPRDDAAALGDHLVDVFTPVRKGRLDPPDALAEPGVSEALWQM